MNEMTFSTPSILFSAITLIYFAYTNRFLSYSQIIRSLHTQNVNDPSRKLDLQVANLRRRLELTRQMQLLAILSLLFCVVSITFIYFSFPTIGSVFFALALMTLIISLTMSAIEIYISTRSLEIHLQNVEQSSEHCSDNNNETKE